MRYIRLIVLVFIIISCSKHQEKLPTLLEGSVVNMNTLKPVSNVKILIFQLPSDPVWFVETDSSGRFFLEIEQSKTDLAMMINEYDTTLYSKYFYSINQNMLFANYNRYDSRVEGVSVGYINLEEINNPIELGLFPKCDPQP